MHLLQLLFMESTVSDVWVNLTLWFLLLYRWIYCSLVGLSFLLISLCFSGISSSSFPHIYANTLTSSATITELQISAILNQKSSFVMKAYFFSLAMTKSFQWGSRCRGVIMDPGGTSRTYFSWGLDIASNNRAGAYALWQRLKVEWVCNILLK